MSEQKVIDQLSSYGDWLAKRSGEEIKPTRLLPIDPAGHRVADPDAEAIGRTTAESSVVRRAMLIAAALVVAVAAAWMLTGQRSTIEQLGTLPAPLNGRTDLVLPGETVLQEMPLVVTPAPPPDLTFDASALGTEIVWEAATEIDDETRSTIDRFEQDELRSLLKVTVLGEVFDRRLTITVSDGPSVKGFDGRPRGINLRERQIGNPNAGSGVGDFVPIEDSQYIDPADNGLDIPGFVVGTDQDNGLLKVDFLPPGTAAVGLASAGQMMWTRPQANVALFESLTDSAEPVIVTAYGADGTVLQTESVPGN